MSPSSALLAGAVAALASTAMLVRRGRVEHGTPFAPLNATSQWAWGEEALRHEGADVRHTVVGQIVHHGSAMLWGFVFEALQARRRQRTPQATLADAALVTVVAALTDLKLVPQRLSPGFEKRLSRRSTALVYGSFGLGLALAGLLVLRQRPRKEAAMAKELNRQVIVVTGASSGVGLATALEAARAGARLVLSGRDAAALERIAERLRSEFRAEVLVKAADVAVRQEVDAVAEAAVQAFGGFDTWINNAGVGMIGSVLDHYDDADARRLMETNFWGTVYGSLAAVRHLRQRGGTLINMASILADKAVPLQSLYSASKHAIKGFTDGLRQELLAEGAPVAVVLLKPACLATPLIEHTAHPPGRHPKLVSPLYDPQDAARAILAAAVRPQRDVWIGGAARSGSAMAALAPGLMDLSAKLLAARQWRDEPSSGSSGNLHAPSHDSHGRTLGRHPGQGAHPSLYNRLAQQPPAVRGLLWAAAAGLAWLAAGGKRRGR
ncbi:SDR family oxidoreductase [Caldimonas tepidiphila]|uniref:SDR family oxidoreductase n=1 Tax=Caldimonas tepidiphila TaxID=2315841 RepID=UPI00196A9DF8|nr:SDR family oxidoreductase [Caldimonas tepidiphila]